jgi:inner membrane protein
MAWWLWVVLGVALMIVELSLTGEFTLFCFGVSALLVAVMVLLGIYVVPVQWISFALLSGATLFWARDWLREAASKTGISDRELSNIVGQVTLPLDDLQPFGFGKAELRGTTWSAHNAGNTFIPRGRRCTVMTVKGLTLWILPE